MTKTERREALDKLIESLKGREDLSYTETLLAAGLPTIIAQLSDIVDLLKGEKDAREKRTQY